MEFEDQRQEAAPEEPRTIWQLDGPLLAMRLHLAAPEGLCWQHLWPFLDDPTLETRPRGVHRVRNSVVIFFAVVMKLLPPAQDRGASSSR